MRSEFAGKVGKLADLEEHRGKPASADDRKRLLSIALDTSLRKAGSPPLPTALKTLPDSTMGSMSGDDWTMSLNRKRFEQPDSDPKPYREQLSEIADTMYHEGRHSEQHFRAARLLAAGGASSDEIQERTGLPRHITDQAFASPLPVPPTGRTPEMFEAEKWLHSFHGKDSEHRKETMKDFAESSSMLADAHLDTMTSAVVGTEEDRTSALKRYRTIKDYHDMVHSEYTDLPEEKDAWEVGGDMARRVKRGDKH